MVRGIESEEVFVGRVRGRARLSHWDPMSGSDGTGAPGKGVRGVQRLRPGSKGMSKSSQT